MCLIRYLYSSENSIFSTTAFDNQPFSSLGFAASNLSKILRQLDCIFAANEPSQKKAGGIKEPYRILWAFIEFAISIIKSKCSSVSA